MPGKKKKATKPPPFEINQSKPIVVDITFGGWEGDWSPVDDVGWDSYFELAGTYKPRILHAFDPNPRVNTLLKMAYGATIRIEHKAAWTHDGVVEGEDGYLFPCFDLSKFLEWVGPCIVKLDVHGRERELLHHLLEQGTARLISELLIKWYEEPDERLLEELAGAGVDVKDWWM